MENDSRCHIVDILRGQGGPARLLPDGQEDVFYPEEGDHGDHKDDHVEDELPVEVPLGQVEPVVAEGWGHKGPHHHAEPGAN